MKTILALAALITATSALAQSSVHYSSWYTAQAGKYARIQETDAEALAGTSKTTWTRTTGMFTLTQATPTYAGPTQIDYSADWVYVRTPSLGTYTMGPWYNNAAKSQLFINVPKNQGFIIRIPRTTPTIPTTKRQINGLNIGGVQQPAGGYYVDGVAIYDPTDGFSYANGAEAGPGTGQWHRDAFVNEGITFDYSMAHQQNTGFYHNHANPIALRYQLGDSVSYNTTTKKYSETMAPTQHSPIIGWMVDGLPVYGPYGYSTATDAGSGVRRMVGGFVKRDGTTNGVDNISTAGRTLPAWMLRNNNNTAATGPTVSTTYPLGRYIQDWAYLGDLTKAGGGNYTQGTDFDLNEYNVRWCVTPEFPSGTWAYFLNISATGTPQFPYMCNRWFYGTPTGGKVNSITETVTNHMLGGPNRPLDITNTTVSSPNVTLTWNAVEGGTYSVDASSDNSTWTSKATDLTVAAANTRSNTHSTLGSTGTEYARVNRTALATYDTLGVVTPTVAQTDTSSFVHPVSLSITTTSPLTSGVLDILYSQSFAAEKGTAPYSWSLSTGSLPDGLNLSTEGTLSGTPTSLGASNFTLQVQDAASVIVTKAFTISIQATAPVISSTSPLLYGVKGSAYSQTLTATGGSTPYVWSVTAGALPNGLILNSATGQIAGTPTASGTFVFTAKLTDAGGLGVTQAFSLTISSTALVPVMNEIVPGSTSVGQSYSLTVSATNYPKSYSITGLPSGLKYVASTGIISGRTKVSGIFNLQIKATNTAGSSAVVTAKLTVKALDNALVGSWTGIVARSTTVNGQLGGRITLTTTSLGTFTVKLTKAATSYSATGYLAASAPQITASLHGSALALTLTTSGTATGSHGSATLQGWKHVWNAATNPAIHRAGYYSMGIDLQNMADDGVTEIPQGSGTAVFTVANAGTLTIAGKTSDGQTISSASALGPNGEIAVYTSLYANLGSICGVLTLSEDSGGDYSNNEVAGTLNWLKPRNTSRTYTPGFGPVELAVQGKYLAPAASGNIVLGLPQPGSATVAFTDGGLASAVFDPDVTFDYSDANLITISANAAKTTLTINKNTGAISGTYTLVDDKLTRTTTYKGQIIRSGSGNTLAKGYFLLPQISTGSETSSTSPILSGGVIITQ